MKRVRGGFLLAALWCALPLIGGHAVAQSSGAAAQAPSAALAPPRQGDMYRVTFQEGLATESDDPRGGFRAGPVLPFNTTVEVLQVEPQGERQYRVLIRPVKVPGVSFGEFSQRYDRRLWIPFPPRRNGGRSPMYVSRGSSYPVASSAPRPQLPPPSAVEPALPPANPPSTPPPPPPPSRIVRAEEHVGTDDVSGEDIPLPQPTRDLANVEQGMPPSAQSVSPPPSEPQGLPPARVESDEPAAKGSTDFTVGAIYQTTMADIATKFEGDNDEFLEGPFLPTGTKVKVMKLERYRSGTSGLLVRPVEVPHTSKREFSLVFDRPLWVTLPADGQPWFDFAGPGSPEPATEPAKEPAKKPTAAPTLEPRLVPKASPVPSKEVTNGLPPAASGTKREAAPQSREDAKALKPEKDKNEKGEKPAAKQDAKAARTPEPRSTATPAPAKADPGKKTSTPAAADQAELTEPKKPTKGGKLKEGDVIRSTTAVKTEQSDGKGGFKDGPSVPSGTTMKVQGVLEGSTPGKYLLLVEPQSVPNVSGKEFDDKYKRLLWVEYTPGADKRLDKVAK